MNKHGTLLEEKEKILSATPGSELSPKAVQKSCIDETKIFSDVQEESEVANLSFRNNFLKRYPFKITFNDAGSSLLMLNFAFLSC